MKIKAYSVKAFLFLLSTILSSFSAASVAGPAAGTVDHHVSLAETFYWFGILENGDLDSFDRSLEHVNQAMYLLEENQRSAEDDQALAARLSALKTQLTEVRAMYSDTFYGVFPLARFVIPSPFNDMQALGAFQIFDDPAAIALRKAGHALLSSIAENEFEGAEQIHVFFRSHPRNFRLESVLTDLVSQFPEMYSHFPGQAENVFFEDDWNNGAKKPRNLALSAGDAKSLVESLGGGRLLVVDVLQKISEPGDLFFELIAHQYVPSEFEAGLAGAEFGLARDRRFVLPGVAVAIVMSGLLPVCLLFGHSRLRRRASRPHVVSLHSDGLPERLGLGASSGLLIGGWAIGWAFPFLVIPGLSGILPPERMLAKVGVWWPFLFGVISYVGAVLVSGVLLRRFIPSTQLNAGVVRIFPISVALGIWTWFVPRIAAYSPADAWLTLSATCVTSMLVGWLLSYLQDSIEDSYAFMLFLVPALFSGAGTVAAFHAEPYPALIVAALSGMSGILCYRFTRVRTLNEEPVPAQSAEAGFRVTTYTSGAAFLDPLKVDGSFDEVASVLSRNNPSASWAVISGKPGSGRDTCSDELMRRLVNASEDVGIDVIQLEAACLETTADGAAVPFHVFSTLFSGFSQSQKVLKLEATQSAGNEMLEELVNSIWPIVGFLSDPSSSEVRENNGFSEIAAWISERLEGLLRKNRCVVMQIQNVEFIDEESVKLLEAIFRIFPQGSPVRLCVLMTLNESAEIGGELAELVDNAFVTELELPDRAALVRFAMETRDIGFGDATLGEMDAQRIVDALQENLAEDFSFQRLKDYLHWLASDGHLAPESDSSGLLRLKASDRSTVPRMPPPRDLLDHLFSDLQSGGLQERVLRAAACLGLRPDSDVLGRALRMDRIDALETLDELASKAGLLVYRDGAYEFRNRVVLEAVSDNMFGAYAHGRSALREEYCARLGLAYTEVYSHVGKYAPKIYALLSQAGERYSSQALDAALESASFKGRMIRNQEDFDSAMQYLEKGNVIASRLGDQRAVKRCEDQALLLDCVRVHVTRNHLVAEEVAERVLKAWSSDHASIEQIRAKLLALYDAGAVAAAAEIRATRFRQAMQVAENLVSMGRAKNEPIAVVDGLHFQALCLPFHEKEKRSEFFARALAELEGASAPDLPELKAKILNSWGGMLVYSENPDELFTAERMLRESLEIRLDPNIMDLPGLARSHGALGRLALRFNGSGFNPDYALALHHFEEDLRIAIRIEDHSGERMMYSMIGLCMRKSGRFKEAIENFTKALSEEFTQPDEPWSLLGILICHLEGGQFDEAAARFNQLKNRYPSVEDLPTHILLEPLQDLSDAIVRVGSGKNDMIRSIGVYMEPAHP